MIKIILFLSIMLIWPTQAADVVITNDRGGVVTSYAYYYRNLYRRGDRVVIDGYCASSCTLSLAIPSTCATPRAVLGFHSAYRDLFWFNLGTDQELTKYFMSQYPPKVRAWLNARGGLTPELKYLKGSELAAVVRHC